MTPPLVDETTYVACLRLAGRRCVVVGGGRVATEKVHGLRDAGADVVVVAPEVDPALRALADAGDLELRIRPFTPRDLDDAFVAVAATSSRGVNAAVFEAGEQRRIFVNVADDPELCSFILPAITRSGPITVAVSTHGASPALAQRIRDDAAARLGDGYAALARLLNGLRPWARSALPDYSARRDFFASLVERAPALVRLLEEGDDAGVRRVVARAQAAAPRPSSGA